MSPTPKQAREWTFLAWIRTSIGLLAGGAAVRQLVEPVLAEGWVCQRRLAHPDPRATPRVVALTVDGILTLPALAVVLVLAFHAGFGWTRGGSWACRSSSRCPAS
ncbi:MAG: DUF202 domain-containing protein [Ilumatobacteraceae bacterium]